MSKQSLAEQFALASDEERGEVLREHLTAAEMRFKLKTGRAHYYFGVEAATYYAQWIGLLAPELTIEFLQALADTNRPLSGDKLKAAQLRFQRAKFALHVELHLRAHDQKARATA